MNALRGHIIRITSSERCSLVEADVGGDTLSALVLETPASLPALRVGSPIELLFKETEVALAKNLAGELSIRNLLRCRVVSVECGAVLASVRLEYRGGPLQSIITSASAGRLALLPGDEVTAMVKSNEMTIKA